MKLKASMFRIKKKKIRRWGKDKIRSQYVQN